MSKWSFLCPLLIYNSNKWIKHPRMEDFMGTVGFWGCVGSPTCVFVNGCEVV